MAWGYHLLVDAKAGELDKVRSGKVIEDFVRKLVPEIDMVAYGEPMIVHFGSEHTTGYSLVQLIETSCITGHFCDDTGDFYIDVFSCKHFENSLVISLVKEFFNPEMIHADFVTREARR